MAQIVFDVDKQSDYAKAFINYELYAHRVDPRITLKGTILYRGYNSPGINDGEGFKYIIIDKWNRKKEELVNSASELLPVINNLPAGALFYRPDLRDAFIDAKVQEDRVDLEACLRSLYFESSTEEEDGIIFDEIVKIVGGKFDSLAYVYFLKNPGQYMPIVPQTFADVFAKLGVNIVFASQCCWSKYAEYNALVKMQQDFLQTRVNHDFSLIDAHSFLWRLCKGKQPFEDFVDKTIYFHHKEGYGYKTKKPIDYQSNVLAIQFNNGKEPFYFNDQGKSLFENKTLQETDTSLKPRFSKPSDDERMLNEQADVLSDLEASEIDIDDNNLVDSDDLHVSKHRKEPIMQNGRPIYPRDAKKKKLAVSLAGYRCEFDPSHESFLTRKNKPYMEGHHLIPFEYQKDFEEDLDFIGNIFSLCSQCHNEIHYGKDAARIAGKLFELRKEKLKEWYNVSIDDIMEFYR